MGEQGEQVSIGRLRSIIAMSAMQDPDEHGEAYRQVVRLERKLGPDWMLDEDQVRMLYGEDE